MHTAPKTFDEPKLGAMVDPLNVRVERLKGNTRTPISLPEGEADAEGNPRLGGVGWTKEDVRRLEEHIISEFGGGLYEISVTDSSVPNPLVMKWQPYWDPQQYPLRGPVTPATDQPPQPQPQVTRMASPAFPNGFPSTQQPYVQQPQAPFNFQPMYAPMPAPPPLGTPQWNAYQVEAERRERESEMRVLRERDLTREREAMETRLLRDREALEAKHKLEIERERQAATEALRRQEQAITELRSMISAKPATDPQVEVLKAEAQRLRDQVELDKRERDAERRENALRDAIKASQEQTQKQIDLMMRAIEQSSARLAEASSNRADPLITAMNEQSRQHAETMREVSRAQADMFGKLQMFMMSPSAMIELATKQSANTDAATSRLTDQFSKVMDLQHRVTENAIAMQPQGSGIVDVVRDGLKGFQEFGEKWIGAKTMEQKLAATSQVQMAQAAAVMAQAQAQQQQHQYQQHQQQASQEPVVHTPPPPREEAQLGAPAAPTTPREPEGLWGRTDTEWFGLILDEVKQLRENVKAGASTPEETANGIVFAAMKVTEHQVKIPAMQELLMPGLLIEFMHTLLPEAGQEYRDAVIKFLVKGAREAHGMPTNEAASVAADDKDENENEDEDEDDYEIIEKTVPAINGVPKPEVVQDKPSKRGRHTKPMA